MHIVSIGVGCKEQAAVAKLWEGTCAARRCGCRRLLGVAAASCLLSAVQPLGPLKALCGPAPVCTSQAPIKVRPPLKRQRKCLGRRCRAAQKAVLLPTLGRAYRGGNAERQPPQRSAPRQRLARSRGRRARAARARIRAPELAASVFCFSILLHTP